MPKDFTIVSIKGASCNQQSTTCSAAEHPEVIEKYVVKELQSGRLLGPFSLAEFLLVYINRFGVIPNHSLESEDYNRPVIPQGS